MTNDNKESLGLAVLAGSAVAGLWSAWSSSIFTVSTFCDTEQKYKDAKLAMNLGAASAVAVAIGIHYTYDKKGDIAALAALATGAALYAAYEIKLRQNPNLQPMFQKMKEEKKNSKLTEVYAQRMNMNGNSQLMKSKQKQLVLVG